MPSRDILHRSIAAFWIATLTATVVTAAADVSSEDFGSAERGSPAERASADLPPAETLGNAFWDRPRRLSIPAPASRAGAGTPSASFLTVDVAPDGDFPLNVQYLPGGSEVAVVHRDSDDVTFFDPALATVTDRVEVGFFPLDLAVAGTWAVVPNLGDHTVSLIDLSVHQVVAHVPVGGLQPYRVKIDAAGSLAVAGVINDAVSSAFSVIDLATQSEVRVIPSAPQGANGFVLEIQSGRAKQYFTQFDLTPDGTIVVLPDAADARVLLYDTATGAELADLSVAASPRAVDVSDDGTLAVVAGRDSVTTIDLAARAVLDSFPVADNLFRRTIRITPDKGHAITVDTSSTVFMNLVTGAVDASFFGGVIDVDFSFDDALAILSSVELRIVDLASLALVRTLNEGPNDQVAVSPLEHRAVTHNFLGHSEHLVIYDTAGAGGSVVARVPSGPPPEGDGPTRLSVLPDGRSVLVTNRISDNVAVVDLASRKARTITAGRAVDAAAVTADGRFAITANREEDTASVLDLEAGTEVAVLNVPTRPFRVLTSPDGATAFVATIAGTDRIYFVDLDGAASQVAGSLVAGQMGASIGVQFTESSGMALDPDGSLLAVCISFDDQLLLIDTASRSELARVTVGDFPLRVAFAPDGEQAFVTNAFGDSVSVVAIDGAASTTVATVPGLEFPVAVEVDAQGFAYVGTNTSASPAVYVIDGGSPAVVAVAGPLAGPVRELRLSAAESLLLATSTTFEGGTLALIDAAGAATSLTQTIELNSASLDLAYSPPLGTAMASLPVRDGIDLVVVGPGSIFADGFESGNTSAWPVVVP